MEQRASFLADSIIECSNNVFAKLKRLQNDPLSLQGGASSSSSHAHKSSSAPADPLLCTAAGKCSHRFLQFIWGDNIRSTSSVVKYFWSSLYLLRISHIVLVCNVSASSFPPRSSTDWLIDYYSFSLFCVSGESSSYPLRLSVPSELLQRAYDPFRYWYLYAPLYTHAFLSSLL